MSEKFPVRRVGAFAALPFVSMLLPFIALPVIARRASVDEWAALGVGQSIGMVAALFIAWGWAVSGPIKVARMSAADAQEVYSESLASRVLLAFVALPAATLIALLLTHSTILGALMAVAMATSGLAPSWYNIGRGKPTAILVWDVLPRALATVSALLLIISGGPLWVYPTLLAVWPLVAIAVFSLRENVVAERHRWHPRVISRSIREQSSAALTELASAAYGLLCAPIVQFTGGVVPASAYVSGERLYRLGLTGVSSVNSGMQKWLGDASAEDLVRRQRIGLKILALVGVAGALAFSTLAPIVTSILFGSGLAVEQPVAIALGLSFFFVCINTALGRFFLVPSGLTRELLHSTLAGAACGLPSILALSFAFGASGAASGLALSQLAVCVVQVYYVRRTV